MDLSANPSIESMTECTVKPWKDKTPGLFKNLNSGMFPWDHYKIIVIGNLRDRNRVLRLMLVTNFKALPKELTGIPCSSKLES
jgi:hypothetical protein